MNHLRLPLRKVNEEPIFAGRLTGKRVFSRLLQEIPAITEPMVVILDFRGIDLATSSFLSEAVTPLRDYLSSRRPAA
jgi:hypothetical protein